MNKNLFLCVALIVLGPIASGQTRTATSSTKHPVYGAASADTLYIIPEKDLVGEGIAYEKKGKQFFLGSIYKEKIIRVSSDGKISDFVQSHQNGLKSVLGMAISNGTLWVVSVQGWFNGIRKDRGEDWNSALYGFDTVTGVLMSKDTVKNKSVGFNDLTIVGDRIFITDTRSGAIYEKLKSKEGLRQFFPAGTFKGPNGITAHGSNLFIADQEGVWVIALKTKVRTLLKVDGVPDPLAGIDGLYFHNGALIGVQNGTTPRKIVRVPLHQKQSVAGKVSVLHSADTTRRFFSPTTGSVDGNRFYFLQNAQVRSFDESGNIKPMSELEPIYLMSLGL